jgi:hypothetical protein
MPSWAVQIESRLLAARVTPHSHLGIGRRTSESLPGGNFCVCSGSSPSDGHGHPGFTPGIWESYIRGRISDGPDAGLIALDPRTLALHRCMWSNYLMNMHATNIAATCKAELAEPRADEKAHHSLKDDSARSAVQAMSVDANAVSEGTKIAESVVFALQITISKAAHAVGAVLAAGPASRASASPRNRLSLTNLVAFPNDVGSVGTGKHFPGFERCQTAKCSMCLSRIASQDLPFRTWN